MLKNSLHAALFTIDKIFMEKVYNKGIVTNLGQVGFQAFQLALDFQFLINQKPLFFAHLFSYLR